MSRVRRSDELAAASNRDENGAGVSVAEGADVDARNAPGTETPLHWAASSDDIDALVALVAAGADIEAAGAVIAGGTPLDDAVAFGQWQAARRLVHHGARTALWPAAALGLIDRVEAHLDELTGGGEER